MLKTLSVRTDCSAVVRAYPWLNGIVLCDEKHSYLETTLKDSSEPQMLIDMALVGDIPATC
jgi:hypothetical protein